MKHLLWLLLFSTAFAADPVFTCTNASATTFGSCSFPSQWKLTAPSAVTGTTKVLTCSTCTVGKKDVGIGGKWVVRDFVSSTGLVGICYGGTAGGNPSNCNASAGGGEGWQLKSVVFGTTPPPTVCTTPQPPAETQQAQCPAATFGPSWKQTRSYVAAAYPTCWTPTAWTPATASCVAHFTLAASVTPLSVYRGSSVTLTWSASDPLAQCVTPAGQIAASGSMSLTPSIAPFTVYSINCVHGAVAVSTALRVYVYDSPVFAHKCSPYPATKLTPIYPIPAGTSTRYNALVIQDCIAPGGGRVVEGIFTNYPPSTFSIPATWADVQPTASEAAYGHAQVLAYKAAHP